MKKFIKVLTTLTAIMSIVLIIKKTDEKRNQTKDDPEAPYKLEPRYEDIDWKFYSALAHGDGNFGFDED